MNKNVKILRGNQYSVKNKRVQVTFNKNISGENIYKKCPNCGAPIIQYDITYDYCNAKDIKIDDLLKYDTIIYGGGLYAEVISGATLITRNLDKLKGKKIIIYSTGITPLEYREYYDKLVIEKNFTPEMLEKIKVYNFLGKMIIDELTVVHKAALKTLKQIMLSKKEPTEMEQLLIKLCDTSGDFTDEKAIEDLVKYAEQ